jgi:general secretion pathway protein G
MKKETRKILNGSAVILLAGGAFGFFAIQKYKQHQHHIQQQRRENEVVLQTSLWAMRRAIDFYTQDLKRPPKSLQDLVDERYLREIPTDPITRSNKTWVFEKRPNASQPENDDGIVSVHSPAAGADTSGKPYNQY